MYEGNICTRILTATATMASGGNKAQHYNRAHC